MDTCNHEADNFFGPIVGPQCRDGFDFTLLFEQIILSSIPSAALIIVSVWHTLHLLRKSVKTKPGAGSWLRVTKQILFLCFISTQLAVTALWGLNSNSPTQFSIIASALSTVAGVALAVLSYFAHSRSVRPSGVIEVYLVFSILFDVPQARTIWLRGNNITVAVIFTIGLTLKLFIASFEMVDKHQFLREPYSGYSPEALGGVISRTLFWWVNPLLIKGNFIKLQMDDLFDLDKKLASDYIGPRFRRAWESSSKTSSDALFWVTFRCFWLEMLTIFVFRLCYIAFEFCQPLLVNRAVSLLLEPDSQDKTNAGRSLIGATALIYIGLALTTALYRHNVYRLITMVRSGVITMIYDTTLNLDSENALDSAALTLMNTDIDRIASGLELLDYIWASPIEIAIAMYLLYIQIGLAFIAPVLMSLFFVSLSMSIRGVTVSAQKDWLEAVERRVARTSTALANMKGIKMTGLADCIGKELQQLRVFELKISTKYRNYLSIGTTISIMSRVLIPVLTLITYALVIRTKGNYLNPEVAFTTLSLVSLIATPIQNFAKATPQVASAIGCFQRAQEYFNNHSMKRDLSSQKSISVYSPEMQEASVTRGSSEKDGLLISIKDADFSISTTTNPILRHITLSLEKGTWTVLTGPIGCGKTMLLLALLNELHLHRGLAYRSPSLEIGYCAQDPWLPNLSIRQLIIAHTDFDEAWYRTILNACVLVPDLDDLPAGDKTVIGSNGLSLSGGQKQRLSLARALYSRKSLLILDDVLGGLDQKSEQAIVDNVFGSNGLLRKHGITALLATHSVHHARQADHVIIMADGGIIFEQGSPSQVTISEEINWELSSSMDSGSSKSVEKQIVPMSQNRRNDDEQSNSTRQGGDIRLYIYYLRALGWTNTIWVIFTVFGFSVFFKFPTLWVSWWADDEVTEPGVHTNMYAGLYGMFCGISLLLFSVEIVLLFQVGIPRSSIRLHARILNAVMQAPYWFFVSTDSGQIINRFGQDMAYLCYQLPVSFADTLYNVAVCAVGLVLITLASKWAAVIYPPLLIILYFMQSFYLNTSRQIRLFDLEAKSPLYSHFMQTLTGIITIRAFAWQHSLSRENAALLDCSQRPYYLMYSIQRWLNLVLDLLVSGIATLIMALAVLVGASSAGALGLSLVNLLNFSQDLTFLIRTWTELETSLGAIYRIKNFEIDTPVENSPEDITEPPAEWPSAGKIEIRGLSSSYKAGTERILKDVCLDIQPGTKVGICGRTGSGKSTLLLSLLRLAEIESGDILIDNIPINTMDRNTVRRHITAMPQDPLLLMGTVRFNVDPFSEHADESVLASLEDVGMSSIVLAHGGLDAAMKAMPLSRGQQQLFCLARAILSKSRVVLLDEMTSSVDAATEAKMVEVVAKKFAGKTVVAVAHHLHTLRDFDRIVVLDQGMVIETGTPDDLLRKAKGVIQHD